MLSRRALLVQKPGANGLPSGSVWEASIAKQPLRSLSIACCKAPGALHAPQAFDTGRGDKGRLPTQGESVVRGGGGSETLLQELPKPPADIDYLAVSLQLSHFWSVPFQDFCQVSASALQELIAVQQSGPKDIGFFGTRNMGFLHQNLIEVLSYAMVLTVRRRLSHIPASQSSVITLLTRLPDAAE